MLNTNDVATMLALWSALLVPLVTYNGTDIEIRFSAIGVNIVGGSFWFLISRRGTQKKSNNSVSAGTLMA
jgi:hypothetical protein